MHLADGLAHSRYTTDVSGVPRRTSALLPRTMEDLPFRGPKPHSQGARLRNVGTKEPPDSAATRSYSPVTH